jgi:NhaP-type Na+/H+ or K+/H+ antiporter
VFFIMLGLWTPLESLRDPMAWLTAAGILGVLLALRYVLLKLLNMPVAKLVWLAPRGLITVLLLLTAMDRIDLGAFPPGAVMLTVLLSCLLVLLARPRKPDAAVNPGKSPDSV